MDTPERAPQGDRSESSTGAPPRRFRASTVVAGLCWLVMLLEGYDQISLGTVLPVLLRDPTYGFTPGVAGWVASVGFVGTLLGALSSGRLSDRYGRRPVIIASVVVFSGFTALCGVADGPATMAVLRFLAGLGLGGVIPTASALTLEYAPARRRTLVYTVVLSGVPCGGVVAALVALPVLPNLGWSWMFYLGAVPGLMIVPVLSRLLPESVVFLRAVGRSDEADRVAARFGARSGTDAAAPSEPTGMGAGTDGIFGHGYALASALFAITTFCGLFAWFGLTTWLPSIMNQAGYALDSSLIFLLVLNLGAIAGSLFTAVATDRWGNRPVAVAVYAVMALALLLLSIRLPQAPLLLLIAIAGVGGHGGQILINAFVGNSYRATHRARALGWSLGAGRVGTIVGPIVIGGVVASTSPLLGFVVFAAMALLAAILLGLVPRTAAFDARDPSRARVPVTPQEASP